MEMQGGIPMAELLTEAEKVRLPPRCLDVLQTIQAGSKVHQWYMQTPPANRQEHEPVNRRQHERVSRHEFELASRQGHKLNRYPLLSPGSHAQKLGFFHGQKQVIRHQIHSRLGQD